MISLSKIADSENVLGVVDSRFPNRWLDAFGDINKAIVEFYESANWTTTATGTSPVTNSIVPDAAFLITTAATEYAGDNMQRLGSRFKLESAKPLYFGCRATLSDATQSDFLVGMCGIDTTLTNAASSHAVAVGAGGAFFSKLDGSTAINFKTYTTATEQNTASVGTMDTVVHDYEFLWDGYKLTAYIDKVAVAVFTANVTSEVLTPSICFRAGEAAAKTCTIHWLRAIAVRG